MEKHANSAILTQYTGTIKKQTNQLKIKKRDPIPFSHNPYLLFNPFFGWKRRTR
jgi:hypothetical protein